MDKGQLACFELFLEFMLWSCFPYWYGGTTHCILSVNYPKLHHSCSILFCDLILSMGYRGCIHKSVDITFGLALLVRSQTYKLGSKVPAPYWLYFIHFWPIKWNSFPNIARVSTLWLSIEKFHDSRLQF